MEYFPFFLQFNPSSRYGLGTQNSLFKKKIDNNVYELFSVKYKLKILKSRWLHS